MSFPVKDVRPYNVDIIPAFYNCAVCGCSIPFRRFNNKKELESTDGVICRCGSKLFRVNNNPSVIRQIIYLFCHPKSIIYTVFCPKRWRVRGDKNEY